MTTPLEEIVSGLREAAEKATPGPWYEDGRTIFVDTRSQACCGKGVEVGCPEGGSMLECCGNPVVEGEYGPVAEAGERDAAYIAKANPHALLSVLDAFQVQAARIAELEAERDKARSESIGDWANQRENDHLTIKFYEMKDRAETAERDLAAAVEAHQYIAKQWPDSFAASHSRALLAKLKGTAK